MAAQNPGLPVSSTLALACAVLCAAGCGGSSSSGSRSSAARTGGSTVAAATSTGGTTSGPAQTDANTASGRATPDAAAPGAIAAANTICARRNHELAGSRLDASGLPALAAAARRRAAIELRALSELEKLIPPAKVAADYRRLIASDKANLLHVVKLGERAQAGDAAGARTAKAKVESGNLRLLVAAAHTGLKDCAGTG